MITLPFQRKRKEKLHSSYVKKEKFPWRSSRKERKEVEKRELKRLKGKKTKKELGKSAIAFFILKEPIISEKGARLEQQGKYLFKVFPRANKSNIKRAIEELYKVHVEKVNIVKVPGKKRKVGKTEGEKPGYKKAIVTLRERETIEVVSR